MTTNAAIERVIAGDSPASKYERLRVQLRGYLDGGLLIAFSGGVDSAFLVWSAEQERLQAGGRLLSLTTSSASLASAERADVEKFVQEFGFDHVWVNSRELASSAYLINDDSRCYHCKSELFRICGEVAGKRGLKHIAYGYNASDVGDTRPGHRAAIE